MTTTVTRADREAAVRLYVYALHGEGEATYERLEHELLEWARGEYDGSEGFNCITVRQVEDHLVPFIARYAASTQVLREAAERVIAKLKTYDGFAYCGGREGECGDCYICGQHDALRDFDEAHEALRSALAAETSGRDGGGNG